MVKNGKSGKSMKDLALAFGGGMLASLALQWLLLAGGKGRISIDFNADDGGGTSGGSGSDIDDLSRGYLGFTQGISNTQGVSGTQGYDEPEPTFTRTYNPQTASFLDAGGDAATDKPRYFQKIYNNLTVPFARMYDPGNPAIFVQHDRDVNNW